MAKHWKLHDDWHWIVNHAWSMRFTALAFFLSGAEVALPYFVDKTPIDPGVFAGAIGIVTGSAFVSRLVAQKHESPVDGDPPTPTDTVRFCAECRADLYDVPCKFDKASATAAGGAA